MASLSLNAGICNVVHYLNFRKLQALLELKF